MFFLKYQTFFTQMCPGLQIKMDLAVYHQNFKARVNIKPILAYSSLPKHAREMRSSCFSVRKKLQKGILKLDVSRDCQDSDTQ